MAQKTTKIPRLPLTDDYIFKRVFAFEGNESVLKDLLEAILKKDIKTPQTIELFLSYGLDKPYILWYLNLFYCYQNRIDCFQFHALC